MSKLSTIKLLAKSKDADRTVTEFLALLNTIDNDSLIQRSPLPEEFDVDAYDENAGYALMNDLPQKYEPWQKYIALVNRLQAHVLAIKSEGTSTLHKLMLPFGLFQVVLSINKGTAFQDVEKLKQIIKESTIVDILQLYKQYYDDEVRTTNSTLVANGETYTKPASEKLKELGSKLEFIRDQYMKKLNSHIIDFTLWPELQKKYEKAVYIYKKVDDAFAKYNRAKQFIAQVQTKWNDFSTWAGQVYNNITNRFSSGLPEGQMQSIKPPQSSNESSRDPEAKSQSVNNEMSWQWGQPLKTRLNIQSPTVSAVVGNIVKGQPMSKAPPGSNISYDMQFLLKNLKDVPATAVGGMTSGQRGMFERVFNTCAAAVNTAFGGNETKQQLGGLSPWQSVKKQIEEFTVMNLKIFSWMPEWLMAGSLTIAAGTLVYSILSGGRGWTVLKAIMKFAALAVYGVAKTIWWLVCQIARGVKWLVTGLLKLVGLYDETAQTEKVLNQGYTQLPFKIEQKTYDQLAEEVRLAGIGVSQPNYQQPQNYLPQPFPLVAPPPPRIPLQSLSMTAQHPEVSKLSTTMEVEQNVQQGMREAVEMPVSKDLDNVGWMKRNWDNPDIITEEIRNIFENSIDNFLNENPQYEATIDEYEVKDFEVKKNDGLGMRWIILFPGVNPGKIVKLKLTTQTYPSDPSKPSNYLYEILT